VALVEALDAEGSPRVKRPVDTGLSFPLLRWKEDEIRAMAGRLASDFPQLAGKRIVLVYPGGGLLPIRAWPLEYFVRLVDGLTRNGHAVGLIGLRRDKDTAGRILAKCDNVNCVDLTGYTRTIRELISLFHLSPLLVTNDGGPGNFASLTPIRSIILFGPETPALYGPLGGRAAIFHVPLSCSPCLTAYNHRSSPCDGNNVCLKAIHPETVLRKALDTLGHTG
jgi:ADP-heptose:LPS heptosyltransferase